MLVNRNPFAREELHRKTVLHPGGTCRWCGNIKLTKSKRPFLYQYRTESDGGRASTHSGLFCSVGCFRSHTS